MAHSPRQTLIQVLTRQPPWLSFLFSPSGGGYLFCLVFLRGREQVILPAWSFWEWWRRGGHLPICGGEGKGWATYLLGWGWVGQVVYGPRYTDPLPNRMTDACENITFLGTTSVVYNEMDEHLQFLTCSDDWASPSSVLLSRTLQRYVWVSHAVTLKSISKYVVLSTIIQDMNTQIH